MPPKEVSLADINKQINAAAKLKPVESARRSIPKANLAFEAGINSLQRDFVDIKQDAQKASFTASVGIDPHKTYARFGRPKVHATNIGRIYEYGSSEHRARSFVAPSLADISRYMRRGKVGRPKKGTRITPLRQTGGAHGPARAGRLGIRRFRLSDVTRAHAEDIAQYGANRMRYHIERRGLVDTGTLLSSVFGIVDRITARFTGAAIGLGKVGDSETRLFETPTLANIDISRVKTRVRLRRTGADIPIPE